MTAELSASAVEERLQSILKAVVVGAGGRSQDAASLAAGEDANTAFLSAGALSPPYDPHALCLVFEHSNSLRQNVDAYATNIDGFGHRLEAAIDFDAEDADRRVADTIALERHAAIERGELAVDAIVEPTPEEVATRRAELVHLARVEKARLDTFFEFCCFDTPSSICGGAPGRTSR